MAIIIRAYRERKDHKEREQPQYDECLSAFHVLPLLNFRQRLQAAWKKYEYENENDHAEGVFEGHGNIGGPERLRHAKDQAAEDGADRAAQAAEDGYDECLQCEWSATSGKR